MIVPAERRGLRGRREYRERAAYRGGTSPPDDPAYKRRPSVRVTTRALATNDPSLAIAPSIVTASPMWTELALQPYWRRTLGLASSSFQLLGLPLSSLTSTKQLA